MIGSHYTDKCPKTIVFNRVKLLVLAIILAIFTILFLQNQDSLSLKLFCADTTDEYCFYQTPSISLAIWIAIFTGLGIFSSLIWQLLQGVTNSATREIKSSSKYSRIPKTRTSYREQSNLREETDFRTNSRISSDSTNPNNVPVSDWEQGRSEDWEETNNSESAKNNKSPIPSTNKRRSEPKYGDKFVKERELNLRKPWQSEIRQGRAAQAQSAKKSSNSEDSQPKSPVSQEIDEVYDANYRTLNNVPPPSIPEDTVTEDEDPDWI